MLKDVFMIFMSASITFAFFKFQTSSAFSLVLKNPYETMFISISDNHVIRTIKIGQFDNKEKLPLVLIHGFAAGSAFWVLNIDDLSTERNVYAIDLLGFARSSRPQFPKEANEVDSLFIRSLEDWRKQLRLEKFILCGHSFGGYISSIYTLQYPEHVSHLILDDPWGFPCVPLPGEGPFGNAPKWKKAIFNVLTSLNPFSALRMVGPWGPSLVAKLRPDIVAKYSILHDGNSNVMAEYMFHCNAQQPSGENAFTNVSHTMIYAKNPLVQRLKSINDQFPISIITGSESWINRISDFGSIQDELSDKNLKVLLIEDAGHHVHADQPDEFNGIVNRICEKVQTNYEQQLRSEISGLETRI